MEDILIDSFTGVFLLSFVLAGEFFIQILPRTWDTSPVTLEMHCNLYPQIKQK
jgi:hypothetical protein